MASITSAGSGNWNSTTSNAPWPSGLVPVSGDTVIISNGHTITVPVGYTAVSGASPANDSGTPAVQCSSVSSGTGVLIVNGTFKWQGPVRMGAANWTVGAGGTLTYDASAASTPATALYTWQTCQNNITTNGKLQINGSSGSRCTVNSVSNIQSGGFGNASTNWQGGGQVQAAYTDFSYQGAATSSGYLVQSNLNNSVADSHFDNCTVDNCGMIFATGPFNGTAGLDPAAIFRLNQTKITNPANTSFTVQVSVSTAAFTSGTRQVTNCDIAGRVYIDATLAANSFTIKHNIFRVSALTGTLQNPVELNGSIVAAWDQNLAAVITAGSEDPATRLGGGTYTNSYLFRLPVPTGSGANMHVIYVDQRGASLALTGWIFHSAVQDTGGDIVNLDKESASGSRTVQVKNCIYVPNSAGFVGGSCVNQQGGVNQTHTVITFNHNTIVGSVNIALPNTANVYGVGCEAGTTWPAGAVDSIRSNIIECLSSATNSIANSSNSATVNASAVTAADYNDAFNVSSTIYGNPTAQFASTPGTHDLAANPSFVDSTRSLLTFDQGYFGAPVATAWVTSTAYVVGDLVSSSVGGWYSGQTQNWRCVAAHTSGATTKPGSGSVFTADWEPACLKTISDSVIAGTTYSGGTNSIVGELVAWVKTGYAPTNIALKNAGHDGSTIGAVEGVFGGAQPWLRNQGLSGGFDQMGL